MIGNILKTLDNFERNLRNSFGNDISTKRGRFWANVHFQLMDHAFLRIFWNNFYQISDCAYRANQPSPSHLKSYKKLGIKHRPDDYLFINPNQVNLDGERDHYGRMIMYQRLRKVLEDSGLQEEFDEEGKSVSIYSFRHQYAAWRLRYGNVPIHLLAKQMGTSVSKIESTYGHIMVLEQADEITKGQEILRKIDYVIDVPEVIDDEE